MVLEVEVKAQLFMDEPRALDRLGDSGVRLAPGLVQVDRVFARNEADIVDAYPGAVVARVRTVDDIATLNVKTRQSRNLSRTEVETVVLNAEDAARVLEMLGLRQRVVVTKTRYQGAWNGLRVCLDNVQGLGIFLELELLSESDSGQERDLERALRELFPDARLVEDPYDKLLILRERAAADEADSGPDETRSVSGPFRTRSHGDFTIRVFPGPEGNHNVVLAKGELSGAERVLCRVSSSCLTGTALDGSECDCAEQIDVSLSAIAEAGRGVLIYLAQEGRGHGLPTKVLALNNKARGMDTYQAVEALGLVADNREYSGVPPLIRALGIRSIALLTSNPEKASLIREAGVEIVEVIPCIALNPHPDSRIHLEAKRARGHYV